jgi:hypothetical protein
VDFQPNALNRPSQTGVRKVKETFDEIVGVICPHCLTLREQRAIRAEKARVLRRLKRGLPSS